MTVQPAKEDTDPPPRRNISASQELSETTFKISPSQEFSDVWMTVYRLPRWKMYSIQESQIGNQYLKFLPTLPLRMSVYGHPFRNFLRQSQGLRMWCPRDLGLCPGFSTSYLCDLGQQTHPFISLRYEAGHSGADRLRRPL